MFHVETKTNEDILMWHKRHILMWHKRLAHTSSLSMKTLLGYKLDDCKSVLLDCNVFPLAEHTRHPFSHSTTISNKEFELLHLDIWEPYHVETFDGNKHFLTIVDDFSHIISIFSLKFKSDVIVVLRQIFKLIHTQFQAVVKTIRSNNDNEFVNVDLQLFLQKLDILYQRNCVHTPQQNGVAERKHRHLLEVARSLIFLGNIPLNFKGHCSQTASYITDCHQQSLVGNPIMSCFLECSLLLVILGLLDVCVIGVYCLGWTNLLQEQCPLCSWVIYNHHKTIYYLTFQRENFISLGMLHLGNMYILLNHLMDLYLMMFHFPSLLNLYYLVIFLPWMSLLLQIPLIPL